MNRREFSTAAGFAALGGLASRLAATQAAAQDQPPPPEPPRFSRQTVVDMARDFASRPQAAPPAVADTLANITYDAYRDIRFRADAALWRGQERGFTVDLLHAGFLYKTPVEIFVVEDDVAQRVEYSPQMYDFGPAIKTPPAGGSNLFSGIRIKGPINSASYYDELAVFQGASYFRAVGERQLYGLSARGLAIDVAERKGEEFPNFRAFWLVRPPRDAHTMTIHALLDSVSATGAFSFEITPGHSTIMQVEATIFARNDLVNVGIAPLTSMFMFDATNRNRFDDFRDAVHDSDFLGFWRGNGEWCVRSVTNPRTLQISVFGDENPRGFGLLQRAGSYWDFLDLEAAYERRPSLWIEPRGDWGRGQIELVEIPTDGEANDNIVAFWRPAEPIRGGQSRSFSYWMNWGPSSGDRMLFRVQEARSGLTLDKQRRVFVIEFERPDAGPDPQPSGDITAVASASNGAVQNVVVTPNAKTGGYRASFELGVDGVELSELRLVLKRGDAAISETWLYRWTR